MAKEKIVIFHHDERGAVAHWSEIGDLVRCKDCKHRDDDDFCTGRGYPNVLVPDDGFCDKGERREDG